MFLTRSEYDRGVNTFSPEGRLFQVEYAMEAIKLGSTVLGLECGEGVVLGVEKRVPSALVVAESVKKIHKVGRSLAMASSGLIADAEMLVEKARSEAAQHHFVFGKAMRTGDVTKAVSNMALEFGDDDAKASMSRPFGVALLVGGWDAGADGGRGSGALYHMDPSGTFIRCSAKAVGAASEGAEQTLKDQYHPNLTLPEAHKLLLSILKQVMEERISTANIEVLDILPPSKDDASQPQLKYLTQPQLQAILDDL